MSVQQLVDTVRLRRALLSAERNTSPRLSPDGRAVVFIRTVDEGPELWFRPVDGDEHCLAVHHREMVIDLRWGSDSSMVVYRHTQRGRQSGEYWKLSALRVRANERFEVPANGSVTEFWMMESHRGALVYSSRSASARSSELFQVDLDDPGSPPVLLAADRRFHRWLVDRRLRPRGGVRFVDDGSVEIDLGENVASARPVLRIEVDDVADLSIEGFNRDGTRLFVLTSTGAGARRLVAIDSATAAISTVFEHPTLDIESYPIAGEGVWLEPATGVPDICTVMDRRLRHHALSPRLRGVVERLAATTHESPAIIDRSRNDRTWLIARVHDDAPIAYEAFEPATGRANLLFLNRPELIGNQLSKLEDFCVIAGDGLDLSGYTMRPLDRDPPFPTVVIVHGGPNDRDYWRFHADAQYFASLGYLSLHINYRGSRGFGRDFRLAGNGEWGGRMQQDLYDAVTAAISAGLADPDRVAWYGGSYGGYAALLAACTRPELTRCAIAISPPCDLVSFTSNPPPHWRPLAVALRRQILLPRQGAALDEATLRDRSPIHVMDERCAPLLIAHGVHDPRVPVAEVDRFVASARALGTPIRYLRFEDEAHHVKSNANREILFTEIEAFLEEHNAIRSPSHQGALHQE